MAPDVLTWGAGPLRIVLIAKPNVCPGLEHVNLERRGPDSACNQLGPFSDVLFVLYCVITETN